jgi:phosphoserine phosphatase RsbU/P
MTQRLKLAIGLALFAVMLVNVGATLYSRAYDLLNTSQCGWEARRDGGRFVISDIEAKSYPPALHKGDEVIAVKGQPPETLESLRRGRLLVEPGTPYTLVIRCEGQVHELTMKTYGYIPFDWVEQVGFNAIFLIFIATGLAVLLLKPSDKQAWLLALLLGTFAGLFNNNLYNMPPWTLFLVACARLVALWLIPLLPHFFLIFPERSRLLARFPRLLTYLYLPFYLIVLPVFGVNRFAGTLGLYNYPLGEAVLKVAGRLMIVAFPLIIAYNVAGLVALAASYRAAGIEGRRRLRVILAGCTAAFLNLLIILVLEFFGLDRTPAGEWLELALLVTLPLVPVSFAYAIARHQVIPVSLIIRRGVRYVLVSRGSVLLEAVAVTLAVTVALTLLFNYLRPPGIVIGLVSAAVAIAAWKLESRLHEKYLAPVIDRKFFRQSYDAQQIIADLADSLRTTTSLGELLTLVATKIQSALQTENVTIFLRDAQTGDFVGRVACEYDEKSGQAATREAHALRLPHYAEVVARLGETRQPLDVDLSDADDELTARLKSDEGRPSIERETLARLKSHLLLPLAAKEGLLGVVSLGPRLGDLPFSGDDKRLLTGVAGPVAFALENAQLVERMVEEARQRREVEVENQRKAEELAYARRIQLSMLPKRNVNLERVEIIGEMRTATEVGGDYYDFIELKDGRYCVAVGDATGHGMAAGLVVGMVKMGLINGLQTLNGQASTKRLVEDLNRALKLSLSQRGMGMCLGVAIINPVTLEAEIISNGMPFPFHYHSATGTLQPLVMQSPPLGFLKQISVRPVSLRLEPDDALVWVSDGFGERMNGEGEIWGDEEVALTLERICREETSAEAISRRLIEACDRSAGGKGNNDDMTIVVAKAKA